MITKYQNRCTHFSGMFPILSFRKRRKSRSTEQPVHITNRLDSDNDFNTQWTKRRRKKHARNPIAMGLCVLSLFSLLLVLFWGARARVCVCLQNVYGTCLYFNLIVTTKQGLKKTEPEKQSAWNNKQNCVSAICWRAKSIQMKKKTEQKGKRAEQHTDSKKWVVRRTHTRRKHTP